MSTIKSDLVGKNIRYKHWAGGEKTGIISDVFGNGNYEVTVGFSRVLVTPSEVIAIEEPKTFSRGGLLTHPDGTEIVAMRSKEFATRLGDETTFRATDYYETNNQDEIIEVLEKGLGHRYEFFDKWGNKFESDEFDITVNRNSPFPEAMVYDLDVNNDPIPDEVYLKGKPYSGKATFVNRSQKTMHQPEDSMLVALKDDMTFDNGDYLYLTTSDGRLISSKRFRGSQVDFNSDNQDQEFRNGGHTREHRYVNHSEDHEVRYAKDKLHRTDYKGERKFAEGGVTPEWFKEMYKTSGTMDYQTHLYSRMEIEKQLIDLLGNMDDFKVFFDANPDFRNKSISSVVKEYISKKFREHSSVSSINESKELLVKIAKIDWLIAKQLGEYWGISTSHLSQYMEQDGSTPIQMKGIWSDGGSRMFFAFIDTESDVITEVDLKTWLKSDLEDKSSDHSKQEVLNALLRSISQFNKKVDFNIWSKQNNPSWEQKIQYLLDKNLISNVTKKGIKVYEDGGVLDTETMFSKGGNTRERRYVNHSQDHEKRYAKPRPHRTGLKGQRNFERGGEIDSSKVNERALRSGIGYYFETPEDEDDFRTCNVFFKADRHYTGFQIWFNGALIHMSKTYGSFKKALDRLISNWNLEMKSSWDTNDLGYLGDPEYMEQGGSVLGNEHVIDQLIISIRNDKDLKNELMSGVEGLDLNKQKDFDRFCKLIERIRLKGYQRGLITASVKGSKQDHEIELANEVIKAFDLKREFQEGGSTPKQLKGYRVSIYKNENYSSPANVVSNKFSNIVLVTDGVSGDSSTVMSNEPHLILGRIKIAGETHLRATPVNFGSEGEWHMFGGNFVWGGDSRFRQEVSEYPIPLHDRVEYYETGGSTPELLIYNTGKVDRFSRPIYKSKSGRIYVDVEMDDNNPSIHNVTRDGEPDSEISNYRIVSKEEIEK